MKSESAHIMSPACTADAGCRAYAEREKQSNLHQVVVTRVNGNYLAAMQERAAGRRELQSKRVEERCTTTGRTGRAGRHELVPLTWNMERTYLQRRAAILEESGCGATLPLMDTVYRVQPS